MIKTTIEVLSELMADSIESDSEILKKWANSIIEECAEATDNARLENQVKDEVLKIKERL